MSWKRLGTSENEDTGETKTIWQCQECGDVIVIFGEPDKCEECEDE